MNGAANLYVHFPFCRRKCSYCALLSRAGVSAERRAAYVARLTEVAESGALAAPDGGLETVYFGGGSSALCDLAPLLKALAPRLASDCEFTVELHPLDVGEDLLLRLRDGGVNRISMGVQSLDDATLADMGRGYTADEAARAFAKVRRVFDNAGIDLIVGYPSHGGDGTTLGCLETRVSRLADWGLAHCSVYSLILEEKSLLAHRLKQIDAAGVSPVDAASRRVTLPSVSPVDAASRRVTLPSDDAVMDSLRSVADGLASLGLARYEISNYALPGRACRHNLAVWRGEDYYGLGEGAHGRLGRFRTRNWWGIPLGSERPQPSDERVKPVSPGDCCEVETVSAEFDRKERTIFRLRTREGLDATAFPEWRPTLDAFVAEGLLSADGSGVPVYRLTKRGAEVCDSILVEL